MLAPWKESYVQRSQHIKKQRYYFANKGPSSQNCGFAVVMYRCEMDHKEARAPKNWCFWTLVLEKTFEGPLHSKEITLVNPKDQSWIFIGRTDAEAEASVLRALDAKSWLTGKDPDAGKDWGQEEKGTTEDEMAGWHHRLNGHEFEQTLGANEGQWTLVWCSPQDCKESDITEQQSNKRPEM